MEKVIKINLRISIKGIVEKDGKILLLKNGRNEWELPGGGIDLNESPEDCVVREIQEEVNIDCKVKQIVDSWVYEVHPGRHVFIVTYLCELLHEDISESKISHEHSAFQWASLKDIETINMPEGYKRSIRQIYKLT